MCFKTRTKSKHTQTDLSMLKWKKLALIHPIETANSTKIKKTRYIFFSEYNKHLKNGTS